MIKILKWSFLLTLVSIIYYAVSIPYRLTSKIEIGMNKAEVISILEKRRYEELKNLDYLCKVNSWAGCKNALSFDSNNFIQVNIGIDTVFVVGFNDNSKVIFATLGDT